MSETKWTPMPWSVEPHPGTQEPFNVVMDGWYIATCRHLDVARLIAAAPDLAQAAEPFAAFLDIFLTLAGTTPKAGAVYTVASAAGTASITVEHLIAARTALSRARGETE